MIDRARTPRVTGVVLAGGRSARFGRDKLSTTVGGKPLLGWAIEPLVGIVDQAILSIPPEANRPRGDPLRPMDLLGGITVPAADPNPAFLVILRDRARHAGPLAAIAGALDVANAPLAIVVAGDMPLMHAVVLQRLVARLADDPEVDRATLGGLAGPAARRQVLPMALRVGPARVAAGAALAAGETSLRALLDRLAGDELPPREWREIDPRGLTLLDVDTPEDLARVEAELAAGR